VTREEQIVHVLAERLMAARLDLQPKPLGAAQVFGQAHNYAMRRQNAYRAERGQVDVKDALSHTVQGRPGEAVVEFQLADGEVEFIDTVGFGTIAGIRDPRKP
jgi:hypothetical protein